MKVQVFHLWLSGYEVSWHLANALHIVGRQHTRSPSPLYRSVHPALIDWLHVMDDVTIPERHLIVIVCCVVIHGPVYGLEARFVHISAYSFSKDNVEICLSAVDYYSGWIRTYHACMLWPQMHWPQRMHAGLMHVAVPTGVTVRIVCTRKYRCY